MSLVLSLFAVLAAGMASPGHSVQALVGATLIDGTGAPLVPHATVVVRDGKIECAGKDCKVPKDAAVTDVMGSWIAPGLIDAHVHFGQTGWADGRPDAFDLRDRYPYEKVASGLATHPERFLRSLTLVREATSFGGVHSMAERRARWERTLATRTNSYFHAHNFYFD